MHISRKERGRGRNAEVSPRSENRGLCGLAREKEELQVVVCLCTVTSRLGVAEGVFYYGREREIGGLERSSA